MGASGRRWWGSGLLWEGGELWGNGVKKLGRREMGGGGGEGKGKWEGSWVGGLGRWGVGSGEG